MSTNTILASAPLTSTGYHLKANGTTLGNSLIWDNGTNVGIGNQGTTYTLDVSGTGRFTGALTGTTTFTLDGTKKVYLRSAQPAASGLLSGSALAAEGNFSIYSDSGVAAEILGMYYWNGSTYRSALQFANVSSGSSNLILMKDGGNVGIGTSSPSSILDVQQSSTTNMAVSFMNTYGATSSTAQTVDITCKLVGSGLTGQLGSMIRTGKEGDYSSGAARDAYMSFSTAQDDSLNERMRITSSGDILATTGAFRAWNTFYGLNNSTGSTQYGFFGLKKSITGSGNDLAIAAETGLGIYTYTNGVASPAGPYVASGGTSWTNGSSDVRKKKNFETTQGLAEILQIEPVKYHFNEDDDNSKKRLGFKAQNILDLIPEMVSETGEIAEDGSSYLTVTPDFILPVLVKAIQEMNTKLDEQNQTIQNLQEQINILAK